MSLSKKRQISLYRFHLLLETVCYLPVSRREWEAKQCWTSSRRQANRCRPSKTNKDNKTRIGRWYLSARGKKSLRQSIFVRSFVRQLLFFFGWKNLLHWHIHSNFCLWSLVQTNFPLSLSLSLARWRAHYGFLPIESVHFFVVCTLEGSPSRSKHLQRRHLTNEYADDFEFLFSSDGHFLISFSLRFQLLCFHLVIWCKQFSIESMKTKKNVNH